MGDLLEYEGKLAKDLYSDPNFVREITPYDSRVEIALRKRLKGESDSLAVEVEQRNRFIKKFIDRMRKK